MYLCNSVTKFSKQSFNKHNDYGILHCLSDCIRVHRLHRVSSRDETFKGLIQSTKKSSLKPLFGAFFMLHQHRVAGVEALPTHQKGVLQLVFQCLLL